MRKKAVVAVGALAAAVAVMSGQAIAAARVRAPSAPPGYPSSEPYGVTLVPQAATGSFGWEVGYEAFGARPYGESYLPQDLAEPILAGGGLGGMSGVPSVRFDRRILLTSGSVASVSVDGGPSIPTVPVTGLPFEMRSVLYDIPGVSPGELSRGNYSVRVRAFDASGQPVVYSPPPTQPKPEPQPVLETRTWQLPAAAALGVCDMWPDRLKGVSGLTERSGSVIAALRPVSGIEGQPLISCANTEFAHLQGWSLESFMLLDLDPMSQVARWVDRRR